MSDMKTFTVRQLDRQPATVLDACDREGSVRIRRRDGRTYLVQPEANAGPPPEWGRFIEQREAELMRSFPKVLTRKQTRMVDDIMSSG